MADIKKVYSFIGIGLFIMPEIFQIKNIFNEYIKINTNDNSYTTKRTKGAYRRIPIVEIDSVKMITDNKGRPISIIYNFHQNEIIT